MSTGSDRPKLKDLCRHVVKQAAHKWRDLGELLELESYKMEMTAFNHSHDIDMCCMDVLMTWLDTTPNASWNQLIRALRSVQLNYLADQLEEMLSIKCKIYCVQLYIFEGEIFSPVDTKSSWILSFKDNAKSSKAQNFSPSKISS